MIQNLLRSFCLFLLLLSLVAAGSAPAVRTPLFITKWGSSGSGNGEFQNPWGVAIDDTGNVYVSEYNGHRIQKFDGLGNYLAQWGSFGTGDGEFQYPAGIAVDSAGNIYVADGDNHRI
jgi:DNA-binding beta-propeller fold protein YncE